MNSPASALSIPANTAGYGMSNGQIAHLTASNDVNNKKIDATAKDFEAVFLAQMMEPMFGDSIGDAAFGDKESSDIYKGMMTEQFGKILASAGGIGIADVVKRELLKQQEQHHGTPGTTGNSH